MEMPSDPSPVIPLRATVRVVVPEPVTSTVPVALPVRFSVISPLDRKTVVAPV